jgi:protein-serine/threonine kinase
MRRPREKLRYHVIPPLASCLGFFFLLISLRRIEFEERVANEPWSEDKKKRQLMNLGQKESDFLRLRRVRLSVEDFLTIQVIGKGGYGEVWLSPSSSDFRFVWSKKRILEKFMP